MFPKCAPFSSTCWRYACGTWTRSCGGPIGVGSAIVERPQGTASDVAPSDGGGACEVGPGNLRCSTKNYTFTAADQGVHTFTGLVLRKKGKQTITVIDTLDGSLTASMLINVR